MNVGGMSSENPSWTTFGIASTPSIVCGGLLIFWGQYLYLRLEGKRILPSIKSVTDLTIAWLRPQRLVAPAAEKYRGPPLRWQSRTKVEAQTLA